MSDIVEILKSVPEVKLKIIPLTWELLDENGHIDIKKASYNSQRGRCRLRGSRELCSDNGERCLSSEESSSITEVE